MCSTPQEVIDALIQRILSSADAEPLTGDLYDSSKTVSWNALREAETLTDLKLIPPLKERIESEPDKKVRDAAYFILGKVAKNTAESSVAEFLIDRTFVEKDRHVIGSIFDRLADIPKPVGTDLSPLIEATKNSRWLIRHSAIGALNLSDDPIAEEVAMEISEQSDDPFDVIYANAVLNKIGTMRAIPVLERHLQSRKRDVKDSAQYAINEIEKRYAARSDQ